MLIPLLHCQSWILSLDYVLLVLDIGKIICEKLMEPYVILHYRLKKKKNNFNTYNLYLKENI